MDTNGNGGEEMQKQYWKSHCRPIMAENRRKKST